MSRIFFIFFLLTNTAFWAAAAAQDFHFIYLQSEQKQAFYIRAEGKVYSSSDAGFVILPQLKEGIFSFTLGFPKNKWAAQNYQVEITSRDIGYQLKKVDDNNWALYDLQTNELLSALMQPISNAPYVTLINDEFTNMLAEVSNTPSIKEKKWEVSTGEKLPAAPVVKQAAIDVAEKNNQVVSDTNSAVAKVDQAHATIQPDTAPASANSLPSTIDSTLVVSPVMETTLQDAAVWIEKISDQNSDSGRVIKYKVHEAPVDEEVIVIIPVQARPLADPAEPAIGKADNKAMIDVSQANLTTNSGDVPKNNIDTTTITLQSVPETDTAAVKLSKSDTLSNVEVPVFVTEKACQPAEEKDLIALRRKMVGEDNEEKMLEVALDNMRVVCYSVDQIGHLATLFLEEESRCVFLEKAYIYCSNKLSYSKLRSQLTSAVYVERFNHLLQ